MKEKKKTAVILLLLFCFTLSACSVDRNDYVYGKGEEVWVVSEYISYNEDGTVQNRVQYSYDSAGNLVHAWNYSGNSVNNRIDYTYKESRKGLKRIGEYSHPGGTARSEETLDDNGNVIVSKYFNEDGKCYSWTESKYDEEGRLLQNDICDSEGQLKSGIQWVYDRHGNLEEISQYGSDRKDPYYSMKYIYTYNDEGEIVSAEIYENGARSEELTYSYTYDRKGNVESCEIRGGEESMIQEYDEEGRLLRQEVSAVGQVTVYDYDEAGNRTLMKMRNGDDFMYWYEYSYIKVRKAGRDEGN